MAGLIQTEELAGGAAFSFQDIEARARATTARARKQAERIVNEAERRAQQVILQRMDDGFQRGVEKGRAAGLAQIRTEAREAVFAETRARIEALLGALATGLAEFDHNKRRLLARAESGLIELAMSIARRVCKISIGQNSEAVRANARHLLERVGPAADPILNLHPADYEALRRQTPELLRNIEGLTHVEIVADETLGRGDCVLRTREGSLDASIDAQLDRIAEQICTTADVSDVERGKK